MRSERIPTTVTIHPTTVFDCEALREALGLRAATIGRELRLRRLRYAKRAGRIYVLGAWVLEWLRAGEVQRHGNDSQEAEQEPEQSAQSEDREVRGVGVQFGHEAVNCLLKIPKGDGLRLRAFEIVTDWIEAQR